MSKPQTRSIITFELFADAARKAKVETIGDLLLGIALHIDSAHPRQVNDELLPVGDAAKGGRPPYPTGVMVCVPIHKYLYNPSDEQIVWQLLACMWEPLKTPTPRPKPPQPTRQSPHEQAPAVRLSIWAMAMGSRCRR